jgi:alcohol dehydrogenase YqhD (iron-dependent ADH family)
MLSATLALNGTSYFGKKGGDWGVHGIGHLLSLLFDTPHGATLSIVYPAWLKYHSERIPERIIKLGKHVFGVESVDDTILHFENYFAQINCPIRLNDLSLTREQIALFLESAIKSKVSGANYQLNDVSLTKMVALMSNN